jgi:hypothetical protein
MKRQGVMSITNFGERSCWSIAVWDTRTDAHCCTRNDCPAGLRAPCGGDCDKQRPRRALRYLFVRGDQPHGWSMRREVRGPDLQSRNRLVAGWLGCSEPRYVGRVRRVDLYDLLRLLGVVRWDEQLKRGSRCGRGRCRCLQASLFSFPTALSISGQPRSGHHDLELGIPTLPLYHRVRC